MPITMTIICNWRKTVQLSHQEENQDTLDAVTERWLEVVELRLWDIFLSRGSSTYNE